jgi:hypothetical protein
VVGTLMRAADQVLVGRAHQRQRAADGDQAGRGKEGGAVLQGRGHLRIDDANVAGQKLFHPAVAVAVHQCVQAGLALGGLLDHQRIDNPAAEKPAKRQRIGQGEGEHDISSPDCVLSCPRAGLSTTAKIAHARIGDRRA